MCFDRTALPTKLKPALEGLEVLAFEWEAVREILRKDRDWTHMREFVASIRHSRSHEAAVLNARAQQALICVEEVAVHSVAAELAGEEYWERCRGDSWQRMSSFKSFTIRIECDGEKLDEYEVQEVEDKVSCWIESKIGKVSLLS